MRGIIKYAVVAAACAVSANAAAQFTIQSGVDTMANRVSVESGIAPGMTAPIGGYFDPAAYRAEQRRIRHERNTVEFNAKLQTSLQQYENWAGNSNNTTISMLAHIDFRHIYKQERFLLDYTFTANFGMNYIDKALYKNRDDVKFTGLVQWAIKDAWSFSGTLTLETQFVAGFKSRTDHTLVSQFMAPGKIALSPGFTFRPASYPIIVTLAPIGGNITTMLDRRLMAAGANSGKMVIWKMGPSLNVSLDRSFGKEKQYRYLSTFYIFSNFQSAPIIQWNNTLEVRLNRYLSATGTFQLYYDEAASKMVQYNYSIMLGLSYKFKNK